MARPPATPVSVWSTASTLPARSSAWNPYPIVSRVANPMPEAMPTTTPPRGSAGRVTTRTTSGTMSLAASSMKPTSRTEPIPSRIIEWYSRTPAATVPTMPPVTAVTATTDGRTGMPRPPLSANTSTAAGTVIEPMSSSEGK